MQLLVSTPSNEEADVYFKKLEHEIIDMEAKVKNNSDNQRPQLSKSDIEALCVQRLKLQKLFSERKKLVSIFLDTNYPKLVCF